MLLDHRTSLPDGTRLRIRLPHAGDRPALRALHARLGIDVEDLEIARELRFDPQRRSVVVATAWVDRAERIVAWGAVDLGAGEPDLLIAADALAPGARTTLAGVLREVAAARRAA